MKNKNTDPSEKMEILIAEENQEACSALAEVLKSCGHLLKVAQDGEEALTVFRETRPDLLFSGLTLPKLGGMELLREVQSDPREMLFVMICPMSDPEKIQQALKKGAADFLTRPIQEREVLRTLDRLQSLKKGFVSCPLDSSDPSNSESVDFSIHPTDPKAGLVEESKTLEIKNDFESVHSLVNYLNQDLMRYGLVEDEELLTINTLLAEALENAIFHGNLELPKELRLENPQLFYETAKQKSGMEPYQNRRVLIQHAVSRNSFKYIIRDEGKGFEHTEIPDPTDPQNLFQLQGRGLLMISLFMDEMFWNERGNEITMIRYKKRKSC